MGLGPPVCQHCQVIATLTPGPMGRWACGICGNNDLDQYAGLGGDWSKYEENEKFLKFMKGEPVASRRRITR